MRVSIARVLKPTSRAATDEPSGAERVRRRERALARSLIPSHPVLVAPHGINRGKEKIAYSRAVQQPPCSLASIDAMWSDKYGMGWDEGCEPALAHADDARAPLRSARQSQLGLLA